MNNQNLKVFYPIHTFTTLSDSLHKDDKLKNSVNIQFCVPDRANLDRHSYERKSSYIPVGTVYIPGAGIGTQNRHPMMNS